MMILNETNTTEPAQETTETAQEQEHRTYTYKGKDGKVFELPEDFKDEFNTRLSVERNKAKTEMQKAIEEITAKNSELSTQMNEIRKSMMSEQERKDAEAQELIDRALKYETEAKQNRQLFESYKANTDIYAELGKHDLYNVKQAAILLQGYGKVKVVSEGNDMKTIINIGGKDLGVEEAVAEFLSQPENSNLIKNNLRPGNGSSKTGQAVSGNPADMSDEDYMRHKLEQMNKK